MKQAEPVTFAINRVGKVLTLAGSIEYHRDRNGVLWVTMLLLEGLCSHVLHCATSLTSASYQSSKLSHTV